MADLNFAGPVVGQKNIAEPLNLGEDSFTASGPLWNINEDKEESLLQSMSVDQEPLKISKENVQAIQQLQKSATLQEQVGSKAAEVEEGNTSQQMADFAVPVTLEQWRMISTAASQSDNPDEELQRYAAALTYGREYGVDTETALQNLNEFNMHQLGKPYSPTATNTQAVVNSFKISGLAKDQGKLYEQFYNADMADQDVTGLAKQIEEYSNQIASLEDYAPRYWFIDWLKLGGKNSAYTIETVGAGLAFGGALTLATGAMAAASGLTLATDGLAAPLASSVIPIAIETITTAGVAVGTMLKAMQGEQGSLYYDLRQQGVPKNIANYAATASGMVTGVTEALFNQIGGALLRPLGVKNLSNQVTSKIFKKLAESGLIGVVSKGLIDYFLDAGGEFGQEWIQSVSRSLAEEAAYAISDIVPPDKSMSILEQAFIEGLSGFAVGLLMGIPGAGIDTAYNIQEAATLKKTAESTDSKEAFVTQMKDQKPDGITGKDWAETSSKLWENAHKSKTVSTSIQTEESATNELDYGAGEKPKGAVRRLSTGELYTKEDGTPTTDTSGAEHHRLLVGDPATGARYGHIEYEISDNTLTINDVRVNSGYENIRQESILSLAKQYPGYDIQWEAKGENLQSIKDSIIESNPRGKDAGLQYFDGVTNVDERIKLEGQIKDAMPNLNASERALGATMIQLTAESQGKTTEAYLQSSFRDGKLFGDTQEMDSAMQGKKGAVSFTNDLKAVIYAGQNADFSTFAHETFHVSLRQMGQLEQFRSAVSEASQAPEFITWLDDHADLFKGSVFDGKDAKGLAELAADFGTDNWGRSHEEFSARLFEGYLADGKTASPKLQGLFKRIAEWMGRIYTTLKHNVALDPRIVEAFDSMLDADTLLSQAARESQDTGAMKVNKVLTQEEVDAIVKDAGREPQQVEQETQLNLYHGSGSSFDKFSTDFIGNGEGMQAFGWGIYLSESETVAKGYAKRIGEHGINNLSISGLDIFKDRWQTRYTIESDGKAKMDLIKIITEEQFSIYKALDKSMEDGLKYIQKVFDKAISNADTSMLEVLNKYRPNSVEDIKFEGIKGRYLYNASLSKGKELSEQAWLDWYEPVPVATIDMVTKALNESDIKKEQWEDRNVTGAEEYREKYLNGKDGNTLYVNIATLLDDEGGTREGSLFLAKAGIPGVRYPIGSISGKKVSETGKSNYVVFDDKSIDIKSTTLFQEAPPLDSQAFKNLFGKTQVVDNSGKPKLMYHGSNNQFDEFGKQKTAYGYFFTEDRNTASFYGSTVYEVYINSENSISLDEPKNLIMLIKEALGDEPYSPLDFGTYLSNYYEYDQLSELGELWQLDSDEEMQAKIDEALSQLEDKNNYDKIMMDYYLFKQGLGENGTNAFNDYGSQAFYSNYQDDIMHAAEGMGYDGVELTDPSSTGQSISFVVFKPDQVRFVKNSNTLFQEIDAQRQYDAVVSKLRNTDQWMKAPNENATNLTERQWVQVRTPAFLEWFGDWMNDPENASKVVDENGEPKVVYHGSAAMFDTFSLSKALDKEGRKLGFGWGKSKFYFTTSKINAQSNSEYAVSQGKGNTPSVYETYINMRNPIDAEKYVSMINTNSERDKSISVIDKTIKKDGIDGIVQNDWSALAIFNPNQIKSATGNNGDFSTNPNILFQEDGKPVIETDFPKRPEINLFDYFDNIDEYTTIMDTWKSDLKAWVENAPDLLQFGNEDLVHVIHENVRPGEGPWRSTSFINFKGEWIPSGHSAYNTKYEAVKEGMELKDYRPDILFQESNEKRPLEKRVSNDYLLDVKDMIDEIIEVGGKVNDLGIITVYHATSKNSAEKIKKTGRMIAKEDGLFFSTKSDGQITGYGESVVKFEIPAELLIIDDIFEDEAHLVLELGNSRSKNIGMYDPSILFQEENREAITEQILEDARGFETWEGMKYYYESLYGTDMWGDALDEAYQSDEWYQAVFNEANGISETAAKAVDPQMSPEARLADEKQKDGYIKEKLSTDEGIKAFMEKLGWVLNVGFDRSSPSMEDRKMAETVQNLRETLPEMVHPTILSNAKRVGGGKTLTERAIKSIRTLMTGDGIRYYRDIYADVMEDPQLKPQVIDERLPSIESPGYNLTGFSITDRIKLADSIEAAPLKKAILSGKETLEGSAEKVIKVMDREIDDSNKQIEKLEQELKDMEDKLSESEMWHFHYAKQYSEASRSLDAEMKQIRKLTNDNMQVPEAQMKSATRLQAKVDLLHDQMMKNRASERVNATVKRHEALAELKEKLKEKQKTKDEAKKVRAYKLKLARKIMVKPSDAINYDQAQLIYNIQATLDPVFRQKSMELEIDGEQQRVTIDEAREALEGVSDEELQMAMGKRLYERIIGERKPLNDWTIEDLEQTLETVANLRTEGRAVLAAKMEQKQIIAQNYQDAIIRSLMATGKYTSQPLVGTKEDQKERNHPKNIARAFRYGTLAMRPKAMMLDNNTQGAAYKLLVTMKRAAQNAEWRAVERRMEPVFKVMKEYGITEKDLYQTVQISLGERMEEYTYSHLMYAWLSQHDQANRNAVAYGNLISKDEKIALDHDNDLIRELGDSRYRQLMDQVQYHLETQDESGGYMAVVKAVQEDFNAQAPRLNEIAIREFNKAMRVVEQYLPIHRKEFSGADMRQQVAEDLFNAKAGSNATGVAKGFQKDRIFISPDHQTPVNLDLMGVWNKSARQQEHFIAFAEYGRTLNRVFKNLGSRDLENAINRTLGKEMYQDVTEYINQIINPQPNNNLKGLEKGVKFMRGNLGAAYLTWKMGVLVLQAITSPMPYLSVIRADKLVAAYFHIFAHPIKTIEFINSKSAMMKNRTMNVIIDQILQESRTYTDNRLVRWNRKQQEIGSMGLTLVDRYAVAGGWLAAYEQKLNDLQSQGLVFADADAQAVIYADDIVLKTQPTGDATEIAPLFVTGSEFARAFTQFQTSLNPIWANLTYDMPQAFKKAAGSSLPDAVRKQQFSQAMGTIVGYALAGALLGAVAEGHDEDDDAIDKLRNWIYWSFTQATASVPLVGDAVDNLVESAVTGDKPHVFSDEFFPGISKLFKGAVYLTQADIEKGLKNLVEGSGYMTGLPVSGYKQLKKAITEDPGALLGR